MNDEPAIIKSLEEHLKECGHTTVGQDIAAAILVIRDLHATNKNDPSSYMIGPQTAERVFKAAGLTDLSDLQAVMDAVERALVSDGVPVAWIEPYILETLKEGGSGMFPISNSRFKEKHLSAPLYEQPPATIKPLEWKRGDYISSAKSIDTLAFTAQFIGDGDDGWMLHTYLTNETKRTRHPTRQAAEDAAQSIHNEEVGKYLSG